MTSAPLPGTATLAVFEAVRGAWPQHDRYLRRALAVRDPASHEVAEQVASIVVRVAARRQCPLAELAAAYRHFVEELVYPEELHFRREGRYRATTFAEAALVAYADPAVMARYMDGLLVSLCIWDNHVRAIDHFTRRYLPGCRPGGTLLEVGPGHGLLLAVAAASGRFERLTGWDVSATSLEQSALILELLGQSARVTLVERDLLGSGGGDDRFGTIVLSEVLEHLEAPGPALAIVRELLTPGGTVWINVPANSPAPDHLFHVRRLEDVTSLVLDAGLRVVETAAFPAAGETLARALKAELPVTYVVVAERPFDSPAPAAEESSR